MTIVKSKESGRFYGDFRSRAIGRLHLSLRTKRKSEATDRHAAVAALIKQGFPDLVDRLRDGTLRVEAVARVHQAGGSFAELRVVAEADRWPTLGAAVTTYLAALAAHPEKSRRTHQFAEQLLRVAVAHFGADRRLDAITADDVLAYQATLRDDRGLSDNTIGTYLIRLGALFRWTQQRETRRATEAKRAPRQLYSPVETELIPKFRQTRVRFLSVEEAARLYAACPPSYRLVVALGLYAGLRLNEALMLRPPPLDVELEVGSIHVQEREGWHPKGRKNRDVPLSDALRGVLERHQAAGYGSAHYLTPAPTSAAGEGDRPIRAANFGYAFTRIVRDAGLVPGAKHPRGVTYHTLRHTFASWLVMEGVDLFTVSRLLGHSTTDQVEQTYGHLAPEHKRRAVERLAARLTLPLDPTAPAAAAMSAAAGDPAALAAAPVEAAS